MNKKFLIGAIIAVVLIVGGGIGYYFYSQASADAYAQSACAGITGNAYKNCTTNMIAFKKFMQRHSTSQFNKVLSYLDTQANPSGKVTPSPAKSTPGGTTPGDTPTTPPVTPPVTPPAEILSLIHISEPTRPY